jgi:transposase
MSKRSKTISSVFKDYHQNQPLLLPPGLEESIAANHPVRIVNEVINTINLQPLLAAYTGGGCSSYHPLMLLKVVVYGYITNVYSSRKLEEAT